MISGGDKSCRVGAEYYGGMGLFASRIAGGKEKARQCAEALTKATGRQHDVFIRVENAGAQDGIVLPEFWYRVVLGKSPKK